MLNNKKILLIVTGSIAAFKVADLVSALRKMSCEIRIVTTESALQFVGVATWEGLSGFPVYHDLWEPGRMMDHIDLNRWADLIFVAPATASYLNSAAAGTLDSLLGALFLAHDFSKPFLLAPAMNQAMWKHPTVQDSVEKLRKMGLKVLGTGDGDLACGETGPGRLQEVPDLLRSIEEAFSDQGNSQKVILITAGGTSEPIDDVRVVTNRSTGRTAAGIAESLLAAHFQVIYVHSVLAVQPRLHQNLRTVSFETTADLERILSKELEKNVDAVVHAAAVSDFSPIAVSGKISSSHESLEIRWKKNEKLIQKIKSWSQNPRLLLVGFKLTSTNSEVEHHEAIQRLQSESQADWVVHNDMNDLNSSSTKYTLRSKSENHILQGREALSQSLVQVLKRSLI